MAKNLYYFPDSIVALRNEIANHHQELMHKLSTNYTANQFEEQLAEIATYCDVIVDRTFTEKELDDFVNWLVKLLQKKRTIIVLPH